MRPGLLKLTAAITMGQLTLIPPRLRMGREPQVS